MKISIGIDQSYKQTGLAISIDGKIHKIKSIEYKGCECNSEKRKRIIKVLHSAINYCLSEVKVDPQNDIVDMIIIVERIRLSSQGFLNWGFIKGNSALVATIVDTAYEHDVPVYSVDTRSWKSRIVGSSKGRKTKVLITKGKNKGKHKTVEDKKGPTMDFVKTLGFDVKGNDDMADAACISLYAFLPKSQQSLVREE